MTSKIPVPKIWDSIADGAIAACEPQETPLERQCKEISARVRRDMKYAEAMGAVNRAAQDEPDYKAHAERLAEALKPYATILKRGHEAYISPDTVQAKALLEALATWEGAQK